MVPDHPTRMQRAMVARFAFTDGLKWSGAELRLSNSATATRLASPVANPAQRWLGPRRTVHRYSHSIMVSRHREITKTDDGEGQSQRENTKGLAGAGERSGRNASLPEAFRDLPFQVLELDAGKRGA